jgi:hypothetical protein
MAPEKIHVIFPINQGDQLVPDFLKDQEDIKNNRPLLSAQQRAAALRRGILKLETSNQCTCTVLGSAGDSTPLVSVRRATT